MVDSQGRDRPQQELQEAQINRALGVFLLFFAAIVCVSIFFTDTTVGKLTNLAAGGIIGLVGGVLVCRARASRRAKP
ncbi:MAG: hypothetical protein JW741_06105 [Sedimentisphaerales bacterium]|nr:hypothetical protein [Sedimentisphaerales bacterium]